MFFNSDLIHLQHYSPRLLVKPVCPGLPPRPLTQQLWSRPRVCLLKDSRVLCVHLKLQQLRQPVAGETGPCCEMRHVSSVWGGCDSRKSLQMGPSSCREGYSVVQPQHPPPGAPLCTSLATTSEMSREPCHCFVPGACSVKPITQHRKHVASNEAADQLSGVCSQCDVWVESLLMFVSESTCKAWCSNHLLSVWKSTPVPVLAGNGNARIDLNLPLFSNQTLQDSLGL